MKTSTICNFGIISVALALHFAPSAGWSAEFPAKTPEALKVVNVTTDSQPGWLPSAENERQARATVLSYLAASDAGRSADAYALLSEREKQQDPFADFSKRLRDFNAKAGPIKARNIVALTWTKDSANAPDKGVYAAFDLVSMFARIDRHCGYIVVFQPPGGRFGVSREEANFMENEAARASSPAATEAAWAALSAHCPNYSPTGSPVVPPRASTFSPLPETPESDIGYPTVAAALAGLHSKPGVIFTTQDGWTVVTDKAASIFWSSPPSEHPAYPAAVKREVAQKGGQTVLTMTVLCEASKQACDDLVRTFQSMNAKMTAAIASKH